VRNREGSDMKTSRALVHVPSYSFALPNASHVRCTCVATCGFICRSKGEKRFGRERTFWKR